MKVLAFIVLLTAGCSAQRTLSWHSADRHGSYISILERWTRHGHVYDDFDEALQVDATFHGPEFRAAYEAQWIRMYQVRDPQVEEERQRLLKETVDNWIFHVEVASHRYEVNDMRPEKLIWRIALQTNATGALAPTAVTATNVAKELQEALYPHRSIFSRGWDIRFPKKDAVGNSTLGAEPNSLKMSIAGPLGSTVLVWNFAS